MANFGKYANLSTAGWTERTTTQVIKLGQNAHIGLWGGGPANEVLIVKADDPTVCVTHEEPANRAYANWRHFLISALRDGETRITAKLPGGAVWASMSVKVTGHAGVRLVLFPGERRKGSTTVGTIYVIGGIGERFQAAAGPPTGRPDKGGHTVEPTPAGQYVLGPRIHVVTKSWPKSVIPWGAALRVNRDGEVEYQISASEWRLATGPRGDVTQAGIAFQRRDGVRPNVALVVSLIRNLFFDSLTGALRSTTWKQNDFGRWGWNLRRGGTGTPYFVHTTPEDEHATEEAKAVFLTNSHGCVHLVPAERDWLMAAGYLKEGVAFEVRPYTETGPP